jgi:hypothetical protein
MGLPADALRAHWDAPARVRTLLTTRRGGVSAAPFASLNLGTRVGDDPAAVTENRARLRALLPAAPRWLHQVHGTRVVDVARVDDEPQADAGYAREAGQVCAVLIADCLPVLLCNRAATVVAAAHAGWRGLSAGVLEAAVAALRTPPAELLAYLGPAISARAYEVGADVYRAFTAGDADAAVHFRPCGAAKWLCDLNGLARRRLHRLGVGEITGGDLCTYSDPERFFSHRRDRSTGRQAALIWLAS